MYEGRAYRRVDSSCGDLHARRYTRNEGDKIEDMSAEVGMRREGKRTRKCVHNRAGVHSRSGSCVHEHTCSIPACLCQHIST